MYRESIILETICTVYLLWNNLNYMLEILRYRAHYRLLILIFNAGIKNIHLSLYERSFLCTLHSLFTESVLGAVYIPVNKMSKTFCFYGE